MIIIREYFYTLTITMVYMEVTEVMGYTKIIQSSWMTMI